jgi:hypothetical protein
MSLAMGVVLATHMALAAASSIGMGEGFRHGAAKFRKEWREGVGLAPLLGRTRADAMR